jgi:glucose/arabinose dehydrogenase
MENTGPRHEDPPLRRRIATGFETDGHVVEVDDGTIFVSDDFAGAIYRITAD